MSSAFKSSGAMAYPLMQGPSHESVYMYPRLLNAHMLTLLRHSCEATNQQKWSLQKIATLSVGSKTISYH